MPSGGRSIRDASLLDHLSSLERRPFEGTLWRIVRSDRDPLRGSSPKGRWDDGTINVLYTSLEADGAKAEMHFHTLRGQPVFPSRMEFKLYEIGCRLSRALIIPDKAGLLAAGIDPANYGKLGYDSRQQEYSMSQRIGEAACFLNADALIVPNARWDCLNAVIFTDALPAEDLAILADHGVVDLRGWKPQY